MQTASSTRIVRADPETVWGLVSDVRTVQRYNPTVASVDVLGDATSGVGASRRCNFVDGTDVREVVVAADPRERLRLELSEFSLPMKRLESEIQLSPGPEDGTTEVTFAIDYDMKLGPLGKALGATVIKNQLGKVTARVLAGMDHHLATGETIGPDFVAD